MNAKSAGNVDAAIDMLLDEIESEIERVNKVGAQAFAAGSYDQVDACRKEVQSLAAYREKVLSLRQEWQERDGPPSRKGARRRGNYGKARRGTRTPEAAFRIPILASLQEMGGAGTTSAVLDRVGERMHGELKEADFGRLPSVPHDIRWRNTAQWARNTLVEEGMMRNDSPRGTWEITEAGKRYLADMMGPAEKSAHGAETVRQKE